MKADALLSRSKRPHSVLRRTRCVVPWSTILTSLVCIHLFACRADEAEIQPCYVCVDEAPYAFVCDRQVGQVIKDQDEYICNLYFGLTYQCEPLDDCCERSNTISDGTDKCVEEMDDVSMSND